MTKTSVAPSSRKPTRAETAAVMVAFAALPFVPAAVDAAFAAFPALDLVALAAIAAMPIALAWFAWRL